VTAERRISVYDGKYTFVLPPNDYRVHVLRHGEPWVIIEQASNAVHSLVIESIDERHMVDAVRAWVLARTTPETIGYTRWGPGAEDHIALVQAFRAFCDERGERKPPSPTLGDVGQPAATTLLTPQWRTDEPPHGVRCLVTVVDGTDKCVYAATYHAGDEEWFRDDLPARYGHQIHGVTAWMPAPEPAKP
jgi:hypothetical protein